MYSYIAKKHSKANNKSMQPHYDNEPSIFIVYLDANRFMVGRWVNIFHIVGLNG